MTRLWPPDTPASVVREQEAAGLVDLGLLDYEAVYSLQLSLVERRRCGDLGEDLFLVTEHPGTFTLGRRGGRQNLMVPEEFLAERGIPLIHIERGGDITYHGPGQLVLYPIIDLRRAGLAVAEYVHCLEEVMIRLAAGSGVVAARDSRNHGVWVGEKKLGSVGIAIRHGIAFHGLALNVHLDLSPFSWVNPCGLSGVRMTTLSLERGTLVEMEAVKEKLPGQLTQVFGRFLQNRSKGYIDVVMCKPTFGRQTQVVETQSADGTRI